MADEEDDYMGDLSRFLQPVDLATLSSTSEGNSDAHTGFNKKQRKKLKVVEKQKKEDEQRQQGLNSAISSSNIGFRMLKQMGYQPGEALGKHGQGNLEPIHVDIKRSRTGLGRDEIEKAKEEAKSKMAEFRHKMIMEKQTELKVGFQERRKSTWQSKKIIRDYRKAKATLDHLEETRDVASRAKSILKQSEMHGKEDLEKAACKEDEKCEKEGLEGDEDNSEEEIELQDLQELLIRLRTEFFYCLYCGCQYESADSLLANCPGMEEDDH